jgi:hypothetical protein
MKVNQLLEIALEHSKKSQKQVALECGFAKPNIMTMLKQGQTRIPLTRIPALAGALELDARDLMEACLNEYHPELFATLKRIYGLNNCTAIGDR